MKPCVGLLTIGQSPRNDITHDLFTIWHEEITIKEKGALDDLTPKELADLYPKEGEIFLVSRLRDGTNVKISEEKLTPLIKKQINCLEEEVNLICLLCTGKFTGLASKVPLIQPDGILRNTVKGILEKGQTLGVLVPEKGQAQDIESIWKAHFNDEIQIVTSFGSPYKGISLIQNGALSLKEQGVDLIVLDCMGYSRAMKKEVQSITEKPVILPRTLIARIIQEIV